MLVDPAWSSDDHDLSFGGHGLVPYLAERQSVRLVDIWKMWLCIHTYKYR